MLNFELIKKAEINSDFYPFFTIQDVFLNKEDHKKIATDFPNINKGGSFPSEAVSYGESIQALIDCLVAIWVSESEIMSSSSNTALP